MSNSRTTEFTITLRRSTEEQTFYTGQTTTGLVSLVGTITSMENAPVWLEGTTLTGILTGKEAFMKPIAEGVLAQYDKQVQQGISDPVVDVIVELGTKHIPLPATGINPTDGKESASIILQGFELVAIERGTSITMSDAAMATVIAKAQQINDNRSVAAYETSMQQRAARNANASKAVHDVAAGAPKVINKPAPITSTSAL